MTPDGLENPCGLAGGVGEGTDLVQGRGEGHQAPARNPAIGRLHSDDAAKRSRLPNGAPRIASQGEAGDPRRHRRRRPPGRAAAGPGGIPGIVCGPEDGVLGRRPHGEFVHVGPAQDDRPRRLQTFSGGAVVGRNEGLENARGAGRGLALHDHVVLEENRGPFQGRTRIAAPATGVRLRGLGQCCLGPQTDYGAQTLAGILRPGQRLGHQLDGRDLGGFKSRSLRLETFHPQLSSPSITLGTTKALASRRGALARASSGSMPALA